MPNIVARRQDRQIGWLKVPADAQFSWFLELKLSERSHVTVPVRLHSHDKGWTQYFYVDLNSLSEAQVIALMVNDQLILPGADNARALTALAA